MGFIMRQSVLPQSINPMPTVIHRKHRVVVSRVRQFIPIITVVILIVAWQIVVSAKVYPPFIIPSPLLVVNKGIQVIGDGSLFYHASVTFSTLLLAYWLG